ncbi:MAG: PIN domain-containing protein [Burkholderiales bacterium]
MIVDSSVWVGFLRADKTAPVERLKSVLEERLPIWLVPVILQEVLQGADSEKTFARWSRTLGGASILEVGNPVTTAKAAAMLYAKCRWRGITPRNSNDCLIAATAIEVELPLLHDDRDFDHIAKIDPRLRFIQTS